MANFVWKVDNIHADFQKSSNIMAQNILEDEVVFYQNNPNQF